MRKLYSSLKKEKIFLIFLFLTPGFWWIIAKIPEVISAWSRLPFYIDQKLTTVFSEEKLVYVGLMRWQYLDTGKFVSLFSKIIYNRLDIVMDEIFNFIGYFSPRIYFQAGDGSAFSPPGVEPVAVLLFPFFLYGIFLAIKQARIKHLLLLLVFGFIAYITGERNLSFLFPVMIFYVWFASQGFKVTRMKNRALLMTLLFFYGFFIEGRVLWLLLSI